MNKITEKIVHIIDCIKDVFKDIKVGFKKFLGIFKQIKWLDIPAATYVRWILAFVVCFNAIVTHLGINPVSISENDLYQVISALLSVSVLIVNTYKNNSTSKEALLSDKIMHSLKDAETNDETEMIEKLECIIMELKKDDTSSEDHSNEYVFVENPEYVEEESSEENSVEEFEIVVSEEIPVVEEVIEETKEEEVEIVKEEIPESDFVTSNYKIPDSEINE